MNFFIGFFSSLFVNNILVSGYGADDLLEFVEAKKPRYRLFLIFIISCLITGFFSYGMAVLAKTYTWISDFDTLFLVLLLSLIVGNTLLVAQFFPKLKEDILKDKGSVILNTGVHAVAMVAITLAGNKDASMFYFLSNALGMPLGYLLSVVIIGPILERISFGACPKWMKGLPITLIVCACMCLAFAGLSF